MRQRAGELASLVSNVERVRQEREKVGAREDRGMIGEDVHERGKVGAG